MTKKKKKKKKKKMRFILFICLIRNLIYINKQRGIHINDNTNIKIN
jgi:hypothetical protein